MPSILINTQVFPPEAHPTAIMVDELAHFLADSGWDVTVCAGLPHHPGGRLLKGVEWRLWQKSEDDGVTVIRIGHFVHPSRTMLARATVYVTQALGALAGAVATSRCDIVLVFGPPLVGPNVGALVAKRFGAGLVNVIYDIYPDVAVETGKVTNRLVLAAARIAERTQHAAARRTIVLSKGFKRTLVAKGLKPETVVAIPVWLDPEIIRPMARDNNWRIEQGISPEKFVVLYAGTIGIVSGARVVARAAELLRERDDILFLFVGEGEEKPQAEALVRDLGLRNVRFTRFQPRSRLSEVQATADVGLVTLARGRGRTSVPSKVLGYMAAGRPVVAAVDNDSDTAQAITTGQCGLVVRPENPTELANAVRKLSADPVERTRLGTNARVYFDQEYSRETVLRRFLETIEGAARAGTEECDEE